MRNSKNPKPRCSSAIIPPIAAVFVIAWCLFIGLHTYQRVNVDRSTPIVEPGVIVAAALKDGVIVAAALKDVTTALTDTGTAPIGAAAANENNVNTVKLSLKNEPADSTIMHIAFSTDCSFFQDWQALLVFHSAVVVGQKGDITRIASGCSDEKKVELTALYKKLFPMYHVHFTPNFKLDSKTNKEYDFYNKPYGVEHWLDHAVPPVRDHTVVAIIDPDMILIRPLTAIIKEENLKPYGIYAAADIPDVVKRGVPAAQKYGLGAPWATPRPSKNFDRLAICGANSSCLKVEMQYGDRHYRLP